MLDAEAIEVLFCANPDYFQHLAVGAVSLATSNRQSRLNVHVITCNSDPVREGMLRETLEQFPNVSLRLYLAESRAIGEFFVDGFLTKECYLRLVAPDILPDKIKRIIYLDCDLVVVDDIRPLWEIDLRGNMLAAAPDFPRLPAFTSDEHRAVLGIPRDWTYVNSGVLLMDAEKWRAEGIARSFVSFIVEMGTNLTFHDQDAINALLLGRILLLDPRWNLQARMYRVGRKLMPTDVAATLQAQRNPAVIHYTGSEKPWLFRSRMAKKGMYFRNLEKTAWRHHAPVGLELLNRAEYAMGVFLSRRLDCDYLQVLFKVRRLMEELSSAISRLGQLARVRTTSG